MQGRGILGRKDQIKSLEAGSCFVEKNAQR